MPVKKIGAKSLIDIFADFSPQVMSNGQIRMECPFRDNHTDGSGKMSFFVSPDINAYHCFSCHSHGNLVRLLTTVFKVNYFDAVGMVRFSDYTPKKSEFDLDVIWSFKKFPEEFIERGYSRECLRHFRVGMSERDSIIIPYYKSFNEPSELLGYQERWYSHGERRVRNNKGFDKKNYLYNLDTGHEYTVLVEGQSDVWRLYDFGYNACAIMGASLSAEQVKMLSAFKKVYLALDNDEAGRRSTESCVSLLKNYMEILLVPYTTKDPGECSKSEWDSAFKNSTDYLTYAMEMTIGWEGYLDMRDSVLKEV